jgi:hypothetical protein
MLLAEAHVVLVGLAVLALGLIGFFVVIVATILRGVTALFRTVGRALSGAPRPSPGAPRGAVAACPNDKCGYLNAPQARYCARCGGRLRA